MVMADEDLERCEARVGRTVRGKWHLDRLLGLGGMAAVYAATHPIGRVDAIKILHPYIAVSKEMRARFEQEARAASRLDHPGIVKVIDIDVDSDGAPFMVMEMLEGESLGQRAHRAPISEPELASIMASVLEIVAVANEAGIVHRDIKPDNVFLTKGGGVKLLDFGIARMRESSAVHTRTGAMLGTTPYMAPEQIHAADVDGRVDVFAVGATMFRILAGRPVHEAETDAEMLIKMGSMPAPSLAQIAPRVDPRLARVVDRALAFDRAARYPNARAMRDELRALEAAPAQVVEAPRSWVVRPRPVAPARGAAFWVGMGAIAVASIGVIVLALLLVSKPSKKVSSSDDEDEAPRAQRPAASASERPGPASAAAPPPPPDPEADDEESVRREPGPPKGKKKGHGKGHRAH